MAGIETVEVYLDADQMEVPSLMGTLHCQPSGKGELFSFQYDKAWIARAEAFALKRVSVRLRRQSEDIVRAADPLSRSALGHDSGQSGITARRCS